MKGNAKMSNASSLRDSEPIFRAIIEGGGVFTLRPQGKSMLPTVVPGRDTVNIVKLEGAVQLWDVLFYKREDGNFVLHRVVRMEKDGYTLCGDGQVDLEYGVKTEQIIGVVQEIHRPVGNLVRGTKEYENAGKRRMRSRFPRRVWRKILYIKRKIFKK